MTTENTRNTNPNFISEPMKELAFESGGIKYYQFSEGGMPIYYTRLVAMQEKVNMAQEWKVTEDVMNQFLGMIEVYTGVRSADQRVQSLTAEERVEQIKNQVIFMRKRMEIQDELDLLYDLATVWFFDETEDPAIYDSGYAKVKKKRWLDDRALHAFFLRTPISDFLQLQTTLTSGTATLIQNMYQAQFTHLTHSYSMLSEAEKESELGRSIHLQMEACLAFENLTALGQQDTTTS